MAARPMLTLLAVAGLLLGLVAITLGGTSASAVEGGEAPGWVTYDLDAAPFTADVPGPGVSGASIIGQDERARVYDSKVHPYRNATFLIISFGQFYTVGCSGVMIAHNAVLTAAHCLFDPQRALPAQGVQVRPGQDGDVVPFGVAYATEFSVSEGFVPGSLPGTPNDFALIHLPNAMFEGKVGPFAPVHAATASELATGDAQSLWAIGYPGDKPLATLWNQKGKVSSWTQSVIFTDMDIMGGQSGSAAFLIDSKTGGYRQVGVVSFGSSTVNGIVRFSEAAIASMNEWCEERDCEIPAGDAASLTVTPTRTPTKTPTATPTLSQTAIATATPTGTIVPAKKFRLFAGLISVTR